MLFYCNRLCNILGDNNHYSIKVNFQHQSILINNLSISLAVTAPTCGRLASLSPTLQLLFIQSWLLMWLKKGTRGQFVMLRMSKKITSHLWPVHWATTLRKEKRQRGWRRCQNTLSPKLKPWNQNRKRHMLESMSSNVLLESFLSLSAQFKGNDNKHFPLSPAYRPTQHVHTWFDCEAVASGILTFGK